MSTPLQGLRTYLAAYEARDLDAIAALLADEVVLQDWNLRVAGRAAVLAETRRNFEAARSLRIEVLHVHATGLRAAAELRIMVDDAVTLEVVDVLQFDAAGRICAIRAYKG